MTHIGNNDPCPCGSGKKYKKCCLHKAKLPAIGIQDGIEIHHEYFGAKYCLHPNQHGCSGPIVKAHTISKSGNLESIAENGLVKVFTGDLPSLVKNNGKIVESDRVISRVSVFTGFCAHHDASLFSCVENIQYASLPNQIFALGYRALSRELFTKIAHGHTSKLMKGKIGLGYKHDYETLTGLHGYVDAMIAGTEAGVRDMKRHKAIYDERLLNSEYSKTRYLEITFTKELDVLVSGAIFPTHTFDGLEIQDLSELKSETRIITFNAININGRGVFLFEWQDESSDICSTFCKSLLALLRNEVPNALMRFMFEFCENTAIRISWYNSLSEVVKSKINSRVMSGLGTEHRSIRCLTFDQCEYTKNTVLNISHSIMS